MVGRDLTKSCQIFTGWYATLASLPASPTNPKRHEGYSQSGPTVNIPHACVGRRQFIDLRFSSRNSSKAFSRSRMASGGFERSKAFLVGSIPDSLAYHQRIGGQLDLGKRGIACPVDDMFGGDLAWEAIRCTNRVNRRYLPPLPPLPSLLHCRGFFSM
jgi:hypothetical protein